MSHIVSKLSYIGFGSLFSYCIYAYCTSTTPTTTRTHNTKSCTPWQRFNMRPPPPSKKLGEIQ